MQLKKGQEALMGFPDKTNTQTIYGRLDSVEQHKQPRKSQ